MKANTPPRVQKDWCISAEPAAEPDLCCLQLDMKHCYSRLKRLVPTIPQDRRVSRVEILQHVIDYILDLQLALERSEHSGTWPQSRTPLSVLNSEQRTPAISKTEDSILCR